MEYHAFRKPKKLKNGKTVHRWYYYYIDETGKQIQKSCGSKIKKREDAETYIRTLPPPQRAVVQHNGTAALDRQYTPPTKNPDMTIAEIAEKMFIPGSAHIKRRQQLNKSVTRETLIANYTFMKHITAVWGKRMLRTIELDEIMNYLFAVDRSPSWKNQYISALNEIYQEAQFLGCKIFKPDFPSIGKIPNKADIFTQDELERFFKKENFSHDFFYLFFLCSLSGGLRLGETRGLRAKQIIFDLGVVIVDGYLKGTGERTTYNKKGSEEHPKLRVVIYPDLTLSLLKSHIEKNNIGPDDYVFTYDDHPLRPEMVDTAFNLALIKIGIAYSKEKLIEKGYWKKGHLIITRDMIPDGRRLIHHSFRYTYITRMRQEMDAENLRKLTGHNSVAQVDYYNRKNLEMLLATIPTAGTAVKALLPPAICNT
jgi:integrase